MPARPVEEARPAKEGRPAREAELDPDRPFARLGFGDYEIVVEEEDVPQWIEDWLGKVGLTAEELIARHDANDLETFDEHCAWQSIGVFLKAGCHVRSLHPPT